MLLSILQNRYLGAWHTTSFLGADAMLHIPQMPANPRTETTRLPSSHIGTVCCSNRKSCFEPGRPPINAPRCRFYCRTRRCTYTLLDGRR